MAFNIPGLQQIARLAGVFNQPMAQAPSPYRTPPFVPESTPQFRLPPLLPTEQPEEDIQSIMNKIYQPQHQMQDMYNQMIQQFPQREPPSMLRRIGAALYGASQEHPLEAADQFLNYHYNRNLADWSQQAKYAQQAADNERLANVNERQLAAQTATAELGQRRARTTEERNAVLKQQGEERLRTQAMDAETRRLKAATYDWRAKNPHKEMVAVRGGNLMSRDPITGELTNILDPDTNKPIPSGLMDEADKVNLQISAAQQRVETQQAGANQRNQATIAGAAARNAATIEGANTRATNRGVGGASASQAATAQFSKAQEAKNKNAAWSRWITLKPGHQFEITPPGSKFGFKTGPTQEEFEAINDFIYGPGGPNANQLNIVAPKAGQVMRKTQRNTATGATRTVVSTDGGKTWSPE